jgi:hypothetical protein
MAADFENACSVLEKIVWSPEPIDDVPDGVPDEDVLRDGTVQFKPPWCCNRIALSVQILLGELRDQVQVL